MELVSIICPIYNEERFIDKCIQSILQQDIPANQWELLLIDGMSTDNTRSLIEAYQELHSNILLLENPRRTAPYAMNIGIRKAKGNFICRIDAHAEYPSNYISTLRQNLSLLPNAKNVGPMLTTIPSNSSMKARAIAIACSHRFGVGNSYFRISSVNHPIAVDTTPFGFWEKSWFSKIGLFDEELTRNQDDELNARTIQHGGKIYLIPNISVTYYARETFLNHTKMFYQYGLFKPLVNKKIHKPATLRQFVPPLFVAGLIIGPFIALIYMPLLWAYITIIGLYLCLNLFLAARYKNIDLAIAFILMHIAYGIGYWKGMIKVIFKQSFVVTNNR